MGAISIALRESSSQEHRQQQRMPIYRRHTNGNVGPMAAICAKSTRRQRRLHSPATHQTTGKGVNSAVNRLVGEVDSPAIHSRLGRPFEATFPSLQTCADAPTQVNGLLAGYTYWWKVIAQISRRKPTGSILTRAIVCKCAQAVAGSIDRRQPRYFCGFATKYMTLPLINAKCYFSQRYLGPTLLSAENFFMGVWYEPSPGFIHSDPISAWRFACVREEWSSPPFRSYFS